NGLPMIPTRPAIRDSVAGCLRSRALLVVLGCVLTSIVPGPVTAAGKLFAVQPVKDVVYYDGKGADPVHHKLDLYMPKGERDFPVVFFVHGGGWRHGDKGFLGVYQALGTFLARH